MEFGMPKSYRLIQWGDQELLSIDILYVYFVRHNTSLKCFNPKVRDQFIALFYPVYMFAEKE